MANLALYRKYRSATFAEVIGQDHVTAAAAARPRCGRINHAYLFSGPRGCGKTSSARILARSPELRPGPDAGPVRRVRLLPRARPERPGLDRRHRDRRGQPQRRRRRPRPARARVLRAGARPLQGLHHRRGAHGDHGRRSTRCSSSSRSRRTSWSSSSRPPSRTRCSPPSARAPTTTRSGSSRRGVMRAHLEAICAAEGITVEPAVLPLVVRAGGGSARDSLSILDQLLAGAGPDGVTYARAVALLGVTDGALLDDMVDALAAGDAAAVYGDGRPRRRGRPRPAPLRRRPARPLPRPDPARRGPGRRRRAG